MYGQSSTIAKVNTKPKEQTKKRRFLKYGLLLLVLCWFAIGPIIKARGLDEFAADYEAAKAVSYGSVQLDLKGKKQPDMLIPRLQNFAVAYDSAKEGSFFLAGFHAAILFHEHGEAVASAAKMDSTMQDIEKNNVVRH